MLGRVDKLVIDINTSFLQKLLLDDIKQKYDLHSNKATRSFDGVIVILFFFFFLAVKHIKNYSELLKFQN